MLQRPTCRHIQIRGKVFIVTGGSSGIGRSVAAALVRKHAYAVVLFARTQATLDEAVAELKKIAASCGSETEIVAKSVDVSDEDSTIAAAASVAEQFGAIDVLIASAGVSTPNYFDKIPVAEFDRMMRINYLGSVISAKAVIPHMKVRNTGRIVFVSSIAGLTGVFGYSAYAPSKFAVRGLAEVLNMEMRPFGISISVANPPDVDTPMYAAEMVEKPEECKLMSEGTGVFSPEHVAGDIVRGIEHYRYFIQMGFDGHILGLLASNFAPVENGATALLQVLSGSLLRAVAIVYVWMFNDIAAKAHKKNLHLKGCDIAAKHAATKLAAVKAKHAAAKHAHATAKHTHDADDHAADAGKHAAAAHGAHAHDSHTPGKHEKPAASNKVSTKAD